MAAPLSVEAARAAVLEGAAALGEESVAIGAAHGRTLATDLAALLTQPPFPASAMDGYGVRLVDVIHPPVSLRIVGQAAAGHPFPGRVEAGQAVRIFTGAPLPEGADAIVIQENTRAEADGRVSVLEGEPEAGHVRRRGFDFVEGRVLLEAGRRLGPRELALAAAMGHGELRVRRRPRVAILSTGDELVLPGVRPGVGQIVASNHLGIAALVERAGGEARFLGIARDTVESLAEHFARVADADVLVTIGGASVGDHDLVARVLTERGMALAFWKIAMRPGKPLLSGRLGGLRVLGLPGNPVSSLVCSRLFLVPLVRALLGEDVGAEQEIVAHLAAPVGPNGPRQHYMRARSRAGADGRREVEPMESQDSSLLATLASADCFIVRPPRAEALPAGAAVPVLALDL
jgi:molybdopterin molybdotransferase